jgi:hypothetical protein
MAEDNHYSSYRFEEEELDLNDLSHAGYLDDHHSLGESFASRTHDPSAAVSGGDDDVPDVVLLNLLCARAKAPANAGGGGGSEENNSTSKEESSKAEADASWQPVREWLSNRRAEEVRAACEHRGESGLTALHFACRNVPPIDVIDVFLSIAEDTVRWPDSFGWLPIHYAAASGECFSTWIALIDESRKSKRINWKRIRVF